MIPDFEHKIRDDHKTRYLPSGVHKASWNEFYKRYNTSRVRTILLEYLLIMLQHLRNAGCKSVKIDGSFVTTKPEPSDFDGTWDPTGVDKNLLDPIINFEEK